MWWDDLFTNTETTGYEVAQAYGGPQEDVVFQEFSQTGTLPAWDQAALQAQAAADYDARLQADLLASAQSGIMAEGNASYYERLALDLAKAATGAALNPSAPRVGVPTVYNPVTGAALNTPRLPMATRAATVATSFNFSWQEAAIAAAVLFAGYKVARAL